MHVIDNVKCLFYESSIYCFVVFDWFHFCFNNNIVIFAKSLTNKMILFKCQHVCFFYFILHILKCCCFRRIVLNFYLQLSHLHLYFISSMNTVEEYNQKFCVDRKNLSNFTKWRSQSELNNIQMSAIKLKNCYIRKIEYFSFETMIVSIWYIYFIKSVSLITFIFKSFVYHVKYFKINSEICIVLVKIMNIILIRL